MKLAQIKSFATLPIILGVQSLKLETTLGPYTLRIAYGSAQLLVLLILAAVYARLPAGGAGGATIKVPEKKQFGQVVKPAEELTVREYDMSQLKEKDRCTAAPGSPWLGNLFMFRLSGSDRSRIAVVLSTLPSALSSLDPRWPGSES